MILIALAATAGGLLSSLAGWRDSKESFDGDKFKKSFAASVLAGVGFAIAYANVTPITQLDYLTAVLSGAGVDAGLNRVLGAIRK